MTYHEQHRVWCDEHGVEHLLIGAMPRNTFQAIEIFNQQHEHCERSIMRTADLEKERIIRALKDRQDLARENDKDDYTTGYIDAMDNAIGLIESNGA